MAKVTVGASPFSLDASRSVDSTRMRGVVIDPSSEPIPRERVSLVDANTCLSVAVALTANDGSRSTTQAPPGTYLVLGRPAGLCCACSLLGSFGHWIAGRPADRCHS